VTKRMRDEHLKWCKQRAREYLDAGDLANAVASMASDMRKHPECGVNDGLLLLGMLYVTQLDEDGVRRWVEGFR
jgi:hypothetical protein